MLQFGAIEAPAGNTLYEGQIPGFGYAPNPDAVPIGPFSIWDAHCRTPQAWDAAEATGIGQIPLLTKHYYYNAAIDDIDLDLYAQKIWRPGNRPDCTAHLNGVPPWYDGPIWLDYELWDEFRHPDDYTIEEIIRRYLQYVTLIEATREMRPNSAIIMHNMLRKNADSDPLIYALEQSLHMMVDGTSPSMWVQCPGIFPNGNTPYPPNCMTFGRSWEVYERLLKLALETKAETGLGVYPAIWYRFKLVNEPVPEWLMRIHLDRILTFEWAGQRVDGYCILGGAVPTFDAMVDHMYVAADVANQVASSLPRWGSAPSPVDFGMEE